MRKAPVVGRPLTVGAPLPRAVNHGGWVNKFIGDAALCVFGVPTRTTDHASQALDAGKLISQRLAALPRAVDCGIGISTGVVTAGNLGNETRYKYTVIGDTLNEAARLSDLAKSLPSGIAASAEVVEVGDGERSWQPAGRTRLRGMKADTPYHVPSETR